MSFGVDLNIYAFFLNLMNCVYNCVHTAAEKKRALCLISWFDIGVTSITMIVTAGATRDMVMLVETVYAMAPTVSLPV